MTTATSTRRRPISAHAAAAPLDWRLAPAILGLLLLLACFALVRAEDLRQGESAVAFVEATRSVADQGFAPCPGDPILSKILAGEYSRRDPAVPDGVTIPVGRKLPPGGLNDWTLLLYDDADFYNAFDPLLNFSLDAYSAKNLDVIVLQDTYTGPAYLWHLPGEGETTLLESLGEVDMAHHATLRDFVLYAKENFPAQRYLLAVYDHGAGFQGACVDSTTGPDAILTMDDFQVALREAGGVDIIAFTAPCLMGAIESAYELRDVVDAYIGSEDLSGWMFWRETFDEHCDLLVDSDDLTTEEIAARIVETTEQDGFTGTMAGFSAPAIGEMAQELDELAAYLAEHMAELKPGITVALASTWPVYPDDSPLFVDVVSALESLVTHVPDSFVQAKVGEILALYDRALLAEWHVKSEEGAHGLSVWYPVDPTTFWLHDGYYTSISLDFADLLRWDEFLRAYHTP